MSNRSATLIKLGRPEEALSDAKECVQLDPKFDKGYVRQAAALDSLNLMRSKVSPVDECPVLQIYMEGLTAAPGSGVLISAMERVFPWFKPHKHILNGCAVKGLHSDPSSCVPLDIRGASGPRNVSINGIYVPDMSKLQNGWPVFYKIEELFYSEKPSSGGCSSSSSSSGSSSSSRNCSSSSSTEISLEYSSSLCEWQVILKAEKGSKVVLASVKVEGCQIVSPDICPMGTWKELDEKSKLGTQPHLSVMTWKEREQMDLQHVKMAKDFCKTLDVCHSSGKKYMCLDGIYDPTDLSRGGWPIYKKRGFMGRSETPPASSAELNDTSDRSMWLEYNAYRNAWEAKPICVLGKPLAWAYLVCPPQNISPILSQGSQVIEFLENGSIIKRKPESVIPLRKCSEMVTESEINLLESSHSYGTRPELCSSAWMILGGEGYYQEQTMLMMTLDSWKQYDEWHERMRKQARPLCIRGVKGAFASKMNGIYDPGDFVGANSKQLTNRRFCFLKRNDPSVALQYSISRRCWVIRNFENSLGTPEIPTPLCVYAFTLLPERVLPEETKSSWKVYDGKDWSWELQDQVQIVRLLDEQLDIRGATGLNAVKINGIFIPTDEVCDGMPVYVRQGKVVSYLEFNGEKRNWQIKSESHRGMNSAFAYVVAKNPVKTPECIKESWYVNVGVNPSNNSDTNDDVGTTKGGWQKQPWLSIMTSKARLEQDWGMFHSRLSQCVPVEIRGIHCPRSASINGVFDPTTDMSGGWPAYRIRSGEDWWMEYDAVLSRWWIRQSTCRGTNKGRLYLLSNFPGFRPEQVKGLWRMASLEGVWKIHDSIVVKSESEAAKEDAEAFAKRLACATPIDIQGIYLAEGALLALSPGQVSTPPHHSTRFLNGIFDPSNEEYSWGGWPIYKMRGNPSLILEYNLAMQEWQIKLSEWKGTPKRLAYFPSKSDDLVNSWSFSSSSSPPASSSSSVSSTCTAATTTSSSSATTYNLTSSPNSSSSSLTSEAESDTDTSSAPCPFVLSPPYNYVQQENATALPHFCRININKSLSLQRQNKCKPILISAATGPFASQINGLYEVIKDSSGSTSGWPEYRRKELQTERDNSSANNTISTLSFDPYLMMWMLHVFPAGSNTSTRTSTNLIAYKEVRKPGSPDKFSTGRWFVTQCKTPVHSHNQFAIQDIQCKAYHSSSSNRKSTTSSTATATATASAPSTTETPASMTLGLSSLSLDSCTSSRSSSCTDLEGYGSESIVDLMNNTSFDAALDSALGFQFPSSITKSTSLPSFESSECQSSNTNQMCDEMDLEEQFSNHVTSIYQVSQEDNGWWFWDI